MKHKYLYLAISVSGASVLAIEILGTRILGPFYGVSLFLWSALITVTLAALAAGYALGGRWADRGATMARLCILLAVAGVWLIAVPWIRDPLLHATERAGLRSAVLLSALVLFFPPLLLLGMVTPYAVKLRTASLSEVGRSAGNLYAISTLASVAAALATGFFLIPHFGVRRLTLAVGAILVATALPGLVGRRSSAAARSAAALVLVAAALFAARLDENAAAPEEGLVFKTQSVYGEIRVVDDQEIRYLLIDGGIHTAVDTSFYFNTIMQYANVVDLARLYFDRPGKLLLVGLGGGSIARSYTRSGWTVDAVEIDPVVVRTATDYFDLRPSHARIFTMDGRRFLSSRAETYEVIVMDAYGSSSIPFHLVTKEAFAVAAGRLADDGVMVLNVQSVGWKSGLVRSLAATLETAFPNVVVMPVIEPPNKVGNVLLFASRRSLDLAEAPPVPIDRFDADYDRRHAWDNRFTPVTTGVPILTDDRNHVDIWSEAVNIAERDELHSRFVKRDVSW